RPSRNSADIARRSCVQCMIGTAGLFLKSSASKVGRLIACPGQSTKPVTRCSDRIGSSPIYISGIAMRMLRNALAAAFLLLSGCERPLPELPRLDLAPLQPVVAKAIEQEAGEPRANPRDAYPPPRLTI